MKQVISALLAFVIGTAFGQNGTLVADFSPIVENGAYSALLQAIVETGLEQSISENAPVTIFGPVDDAFFNATDRLENLSTDELIAVSWFGRGVD